MITRFLFYFLIGVVFCACGNEERKGRTIDEELMIEVPESSLYVRVRGNKQGPLLINLHGGPGGYSGIDIKFMGPGLEEKFLVAYLDQRGCGKSAGCTNDSLLTIAQYVEDLDAVIDTLRHFYKKNKVNLVGTSWGGLYGFLYLLSDQSKVNAFACIDGKVNSDYQNDFLLEFQVQKVQELLKSETKEQKIAELRTISRELERIKNAEYENFYEDVNWMLHEVSPKLGFNAYFADTSKMISFDAVLQDTALLNLMNYTAPEYLSIAEKAGFVNRAFLNGNEYNQVNIEKELQDIRIPVTVIQGEFDYVVGTGHAALIYDALTGLPPGLKELHILPETGHCPALECPEKLSEVLNAFFIKYAD